MLTMNRRNLYTFAPVLLALFAAALVVIFGPEERSLGDGIRSVYMHVPLSVVGRLALTLVGGLGLIVLLTAREGVFRWSQAIGWVGLLLLGGGFVVSLYSSYDNWGAVYWGEPRTLAVMQSLALVLIVQVINMWHPPVRIRGLLHVFLTVAMTWLLTRADLVLHPESPITSSNATAIQMTFGVLVLLCLSSAAWVVWRSVSHNRE